MKPSMIPVNQPDIGALEKKFVQDCLDSGWISSAGHYVKEFENQFATYCDCQYGTTTTNGTTAIHLALKSLDIKAGDEVLVPSFTMAGSVYPIVQCGAIPVFVDSDIHTFNVDIDDLRKKITSRAKAILVVHLYGHPADMDPIMEIAQQHQLWVIEDAAEAHGALYKNKKVGGIGHVGCFSFYSNKIITTGEGGMIVTNDEAIIAKARRLKDLAHGEIRFTHDLPEAYNYRMTNMQAAIGLGQLNRIETIIQKKIANAHRYNELLKAIPDFMTPICEDWARNVYWMYSVKVKDNSKISKDHWMELLKQEGVETRSFFYPLHQQKAFAAYGKNDCPRADWLSQVGFYLPSGQALSFEQIDCVVEAATRIYAASNPL